MSVSSSQSCVLTYYQEAEGLFKRIDQLEDKGELIEYLAAAYGGLQNHQQISRWFHMYGRCVYGKMEKSSRLFEFSLSVQLVALGIFNYEILPELENDFEQISKDLKNHSFDMLYVMIEKTSTMLQEKFLEAGDQEALLAAKNLRWLGHSLQNIDEYDNAEYLPRFTAIYDLAKNILAKVKDEEAKREKTDIFYNTVEFLHELEHPGDTLGAFTELEKIKPLLEAEGDCLHAKIKWAQLHNKEALKLRHLASQANDEAGKINLLKQQYEAVSKALKIAHETEGFDFFLKIMFTQNSAKIALQCAEKGSPVLDNDTIRENLNIVLEAITDYDHYYHVTFLTTVAQFEKFCGNNEKALEHVNFALELCEKKFSKSCKEEKATLEALKKEIEEIE